jgi:AcrR family transcriptional regulator
MREISDQGGDEAATGRRRARRSTAEIRLLILDAARAVFAERGFAGATTKLIATRAEVAEPLIFNNFGSKATLFTDAVIEPFNARFREFLVYSETLPSDRRQRSAHYVHALYPFLRDHADLLLALVKSAGDVDANAIHGLDDYFQRAVSRIRSQFEDAGLQFDVPPELMVRYGFGMLAGTVLLRDWFFPEGMPDDGVAEAALARVLFKVSEPWPVDRDETAPD